MTRGIAEQEMLPWGNKLKKLLKKQGFTLVELIIVIAIIAVLAVSAFMMLTKWLGKSRDSRRLSDIGTIKKALEIAYSDTDNQVNQYPDATNSGAILDPVTNTMWFMGVFGLDTIETMDNMQKAPQDPSDQTYYKYATTLNKREFQVGALLEDGREVSALGTVMAGSPVARVDGNYDGYVNYASGSNKMIIRIPSLLVYSGTTVGTLSGSVGNDMFMVEGEDLGVPLVVRSYELVDGVSPDLGAVADALGLDTETVGVVIESEVGKVVENSTGEPSVVGVTINLSFSNENDWLQENNINGTTIESNSVTLKGIDSYTNDVVPTMSSDNDTEVEVIYSTQTTDRPWWRIFQDTSGSSFNTCGEINGKTYYEGGRVGVHFKNESKTIKQYTLKSRSDNGNTMLSDWYFEGSNNGTDWDNLDSKTNISWNGGEYKIYPITNSTAYSYYRIKILKGGENRVNIDEMELMEAISSSYSLQPYYLTTSNSNQIPLANVSKINSIDITNSQPVNTSIKGLVSFDGRTTWKKWNGTTWIDGGSLNDLQSGNTIDEMESGFSELNLNGENSLDFAFDLSTTSNTSTPEITNIEVNYIE